MQPEQPVRPKERQSFEVTDRQGITFARLLRPGVWREAAVSLLAVLLLASAAASWAAPADKLTFAESYSEAYGCSWECPDDFEELLDIFEDLPGFDLDELREENCEKICAERVTITVSIKGSLLMPGLRHLDFTQADFQLTVGGLEFDFSESSSASSNRVVFSQYRYVFDEGGDEIRRRVGKVELSKKGDRLSITATRKSRVGSAIAWEYTDDQGFQNGAVNTGFLPFQLSIDGTTIERFVPFRTQTTVKTKVKTNDEGDTETYVLSTVKVAGTGIWPSPSIAILSPTPAQRWSNEVIAVTGSVSGLVDVTNVFVRFNEGDNGLYEIAAEGGLWSIDLDLTPGTNRVTAYTMDAAGNFSESATVVFSYVKISPLDLQIDPNPASGNLVGPRIDGGLEEGVSYNFVPQPASGYLFEKWQVDSPTAGVIEQNGATQPRLAFRHESGLRITAFFVANPFPAIPARYAGLVQPTGGINTIDGASGFGSVAMQLSSVGQLTFKMLADGLTYTWSGRVQPRLGTVGFSLTRTKTAKIHVSLLFDLQTGALVSGTVTDDVAGESTLVAYPAATPTAVAEFVGAHTFLIPGANITNVAVLPAGDGNGQFKISVDGNLKFAGTAGDGTAFSMAVPVVIQGANTGTPSFAWPLHYATKKGMLALNGFMSLHDAEEGLSGGSLHWQRKPDFKAKVYPLGFNRDTFLARNEEPVLRSARYVAPGGGTNALGWSAGVIELEGGNVVGKVSVPILISADNRVVVEGVNVHELKVKLTPKSGSFSGSMLHPVSRKKTSFKGTILQSGADRIAGGTFFGWDQTGRVRLAMEP